MEIESAGKIVIDLCVDCLWSLSYAELRQVSFLVFSMRAYLDAMRYDVLRC